MIRSLTVAVLSVLVLNLHDPVLAQAPVKSATDVEALFTDDNPELHANKQVVYHILLDLLQANHWERADQYLTERYIQHNPNVTSGREAVVEFFTKVLGAKPEPLPQELAMPVVAVVAEGDLVTVAFVREEKHPADATKTYTTTWFDMWRIKDGKADEHWDAAVMQPPPAE